MRMDYQMDPEYEPYKQLMSKNPYVNNPDKYLPDIYA